MDTLFINSENSKMSKPHVLVLKLTNKLDLRIDKNFKFKIYSPIWNYKFELLHRLYSISDIQDYFKYILKTHGENKPSAQIYVSKIENTVTFKIKNGYNLKLFTPEKMKLFESTENKIIKDKNGGNVSHLQITELELVHIQ